MRRGFTLIELLVVVSIIAVLMGILIPAVSYVRRAGKVASTQALLAELQGAVERYHMDYRAYPCPWANDTSFVRMDTLPGTDPRRIEGITGRVTMSEGLALSLLGGLERNAGTGLITYSPSLVGSGPRMLPATGANINKPHTAYMESISDLSTHSVNSDPGNPGHFKDGAGEASDSNIPEFVDRFDSPMPVLYLRARVGAANVFAFGPAGNLQYSVISDAFDVRGTGSAFAGTAPVQYDINQIFGYVGSFAGAWPNAIAPAPLDGQERPGAGSAAIGEGKSAEYWFGPAGTGSTDQGPHDAADLQAATGRPPYHGLFAMGYPAGPVGDPQAVTPLHAPAYFRNPAFGTDDRTPARAAQRAQNQPRGKDAYLLISAGPDRVYGTADDITSFGSVMP